MIPKGRPAKIIFLFPLLLASWINFGWLQPAWSQAIHNTPRVAIYYQRPSDLIDMERRLNFFPEENLPKKHPSTRVFPGADQLPALTAKVEGILARVCLRLKARPKEGVRLRIFLLPDGGQVKQRQLLFQVSGQARKFPFIGYGKLEAFYEPRTRTIFLSLADLYEGILAHEMVHFCLGTAFSTILPKEIQEELARNMEYSLR